MSRGDLVEPRERAFKAAAEKNGHTWGFYKDLDETGDECVDAPSVSYLGGIY